MFFKYKFGIEAKDYSHLAQLQNLEDVEIQTEWIIDTLYEVQETVEYATNVDIWHSSVIQEHDEEIRSISSLFDWFDLFLVDLDKKLILFSGITIIVLIVLSVFQTMMLKRRLVKAKLL